ncbi:MULTISPECIES: Dyp-type peroxidase [Natrialbaceae]|uniref:Dyp-type peroxidase n=1 Tax=Natrialbaceae TaxID=1644061 RepID=UPI00207CCD62|nr:Dyp-type peroxidase [Natronococcus sp. CG52]
MTSERSRRAFIRAAVASGGSAALAACLEDGTSLGAPKGVADPTSLPDRQHAWNDVLSKDQDGNARPPKHHVFLSLSLSGELGAAARETVVSALSEVERALEWSTNGILFTLGYTPAYFDRFDASLDDAVDLPKPNPIVVLSVESDVTVDTNDALLHLASDDGAVVLAVEEALFGEREHLNGRSMSASLDTVFERTSRRTGFVGPGLPADRQSGLEGIPEGEPVPEKAPFFMGFRSGFQESQATEDRVTILEGSFAGGSTQHFETIELDLEVWFEESDHEQRVARMFSPDHSERKAVGEYGERLGTKTSATTVTDKIHEHARKKGVVGHAQKLARARENGNPVLLRRDVNTTDGDVCGLHFVSLQRKINEFTRMREAMVGEEFRQYGLGPRQSNGILQYLRIRRWGSYLVPPRTHRALPRPTPVM